MFSKSKNEQSAKAQRSAKPSGPLSILAADVCITGNIEAAGEIQLDGTVDGDIHCGGLTLGETGSVAGEIRAEHATIRGVVNGTILARTILFEKTARITGDIVHESISIEVGAHVDGRLINRENPLDPASEQPGAKLKAVASPQ
jgi:cytoskeletal protein CcmA (bactofilin family)